MKSRLFRHIIILLLGFSSGLPLALSASTLQAWYAVSGMDVVTIGSLALVGQPYMLKFLWAPILDRALPLALGRRRTWMLITQVSTIIVLLVMSLFTPLHHPVGLALLALCLAFASATQDVAIDAYRADILPAEERGLGAAMAVGGYRLGMLLSGGVGLILADHLGWREMYQWMALAMSVGVLTVLIAPSPPRHAPPPSTLRAAIVDPLQEFFKRDYALLFLLLIVLFKLGETFTSTSGIMTNTFLLQGLGFTLSSVGMVNKIVGLGAVLVGIFLGGLLMMRISLYTALISFGLLQGVSNLSYAFLALVGKNMTVLVAAVILDNLSAGLGNAAIIALLMSLCDSRYSATQYALLSAVAISGRILLGPIAGLMVESMGWFLFFIATFFLALPGVGLAWWMKQHQLLHRYIPGDVPVTSEDGSF